MKLHNTINGEELKEKIKASDEKRTTISFYKYAQIGNPQLFRDHLFFHWDQLGILGRIYVAYEGINAQLSVPTKNLEAYKAELENITFLKGVRLNFAVDDNGKSFFKLAIKVRSKIVADGLEDDLFDVSKPGNYLNVEEFNKLTDDENTLLIDMRNHYESEVGHFVGAITPDVETFRDSLPIINEQLKEFKEDKNLVMYCTGGIRCEKASAYYKHQGFKNVFQLEGGIINYAKQIKEEGLESKFIGKNFVFDHRLGERITDDIISQCHQCGAPCDMHVNCANEACHLLFIQCDSCAEKMENCCSTSCVETIYLPLEEQENRRKGLKNGNMGLV